MRDKPNVTVLLVHEDDEMAASVQAAAQSLQHMKDLTLLRGAQELMAYLDRCHPTLSGESVPCPNLILFDLQPTLDHAQEVLVRLKQDEVFKPIPVVVLARTRVDTDHGGTYDLGVNAFVRRPDHPDELAKTLQIIENFWLGVVTLPRAERSARSF